MGVVKTLTPGNKMRWIEAYEQVACSQALTLLLMHAPAQVNAMPINWRISNTGAEHYRPLLAGSAYRTKDTPPEEIELIMEEWAAYLAAKVGRYEMNDGRVQLTVTAVVEDIDPKIMVDITAVISPDGTGK